MSVITIDYSELEEKDIQIEILRAMDLFNKVVLGDMVVKHGITIRHLMSLAPVESIPRAEDVWNKGIEKMDVDIQQAKDRVNEALAVWGNYLQTHENAARFFTSVIHAGAAGVARG